MTGQTQPYKCKHTTTLAKKSILQTAKQLANACLFMFALVLHTPVTQSQDITFNEHIAPIIFQKCTSCHNSNSIGPFPFTSYTEVEQYGAMVQYVTASKYMPPWFADPTYTTFGNQVTLTDEEIELIEQWVQGGTPEGESPIAPEVQKLLELDTMPFKPDLTVCMEESHEILGDKRDSYRNFAIPIPLNEDHHIKSIEFVPGNVRAVHHAWVLIDTSGHGYRLAQEDTSGYGYDGWKGMGFTPMGMSPGYLPGLLPIEYPDKSGKTIPGNSHLVLLNHYAPNSITVSDSSCVNLYYIDSAIIDRQVKTLLIEEESMLNASFPLAIPANSIQSYTLKYDIESDISIISMIPHMHFRGKHFIAFAVTAQLDTIPLIQIHDWDFNWQSSYVTEKLVHIPEGSSIYVHGTFDNTADNPYNPVIPTIAVLFGPGSENEMLNFVLEYIDYRVGDELISSSLLSNLGKQLQD